MKLETRNPNQPIGILLLAFGCPHSLDDVGPFLENIFSGRPLTPFLIDQVRERYQFIGGKSPLLEITESQARSLKVGLQKAGKAMDVYIGMRHWHPYIREPLKTMGEKGIKKVLCLILSPFSTAATAESYEDAVQQAINDSTKKMKVDFVPSWHTNPLYLDAVFEKVKEGLALFSPHRQSYVQIIFTAHSLPLSTVRNDPYVDQIKTTICGVMKRLKNHKWHLAFQSSGTGDEKWLSPNVKDVLEIIARHGTKEVLMVPIGFVSDHLETLYDLDISLKKKADNLGLQYQRSPSLNDSPKFIKALTNVVLLFLEQADQALP
ncbi:MAG: ferrochelatase [Proteobacteria bacterium]|nr:ferrochelatase [Pseudomonadota bacterium]